MNIAFLQFPIHPSLFQSKALTCRQPGPTPPVLCTGLSGFNVLALYWPKRYGWRADRYGVKSLRFPMTHGLRLRAWRRMS